MKALVAWAKLVGGQDPRLALLFHIPNGGGLLNPRTAGRLKAMGLKRGVPDFFLSCPVGNRAGLFIEMKAATGGRVSAEQQWWHDQLRHQGYVVVVCAGWAVAAETIQRYLRGVLSPAMEEAYA